MKKIIISFFALSLMGFVLGFGSNVARAADPVVDQQSTSGTGSLLIYTGSRMAQTFRPAVATLDRVAIEVANANAVSKVDVYIRIYEGSSWTDVSGASVIGQTVTNGWNTFDFTDQTLTVDGRYAIFVYNGSGDPSDSAQWKYSISDPYSRGYAIWQTTDKTTWDFNFKTYTPGVDAPATETASPNNSSSGTTATTTTTTTTATTTPATSTSATVVAPTKLTASYSSGVILSWTKSTTASIDGYRVYRSLKKSSQFDKVGTVAKDKATYTDTSAAADTTYYYFVRAYLGATESASSNTVSIKTEKGAVAETVKTTPTKVLGLIVEDEEGFNWFNFCLLSIGGLLVLVLAIYEIWRWRKTGRFLNHHLRSY